MKVLIIDDYPMWVMIVGQVIAHQFPGAELLTATNLRDGIEKAASTSPPKLVILDLGLPDSHGPATVAKFRAAQPTARIFVLTADNDCATIAACRKSGVAGYVHKSAGPDAVAIALRIVANGGTCLPPRPATTCSHNTDLTQRQLEVLRLIARGLGNKDIARSLSIAENTVKGHARDAYSALGVSSRVQAVRALERLGIQLD